MYNTDYYFGKISQMMKTLEKAAFLFFFRLKLTNMLIFFEYKKNSIFFWKIKGFLILLKSEFFKCLFLSTKLLIF